MAGQEKTINIDYYISLILKHRWLIIIPLFISITVGIFLAIRLDRVYQAKTLILIEPQRVPANYVQSLVSTDIDSRISTIRQQVLSRTNLEKILEQFKLYAGPEHKNLFIEDKIEKLREKIGINVTRARGGASAFSIEFEGKDPQAVMKIANLLATFFIDENLKVREAQAIGTSSFLDDELEMTRERLESLEDALKIYRERYMGEMPEQLETNLRILDRLQLELGEREESLRSARNRLASLDSQERRMQRMPQIPSIDGQTVATGQIEFGAEEGAEQLDSLKRQLHLFRTRYTEKHPDVLKLKNMIAKLEAEHTNVAGDSKEKPTASDNQGIPSQDVPRTAADAERLSQKNEIQLEINSLSNDIAKARLQIKEYERRIENMPKREQELLSLNRDYANIQAQYNSLLSRKLEAEIAVNMERKQKGEQFRILDPARLPIKPIKPDVKKLLFMTLFIGIGLGVGFIFMIDFFDTSFKSHREIETVLGFPILAVIPGMQNRKETLLKRINLALSIISVGITLSAIAGFAVLAFIGLDATKALVMKYISL